MSDEKETEMPDVVGSITRLFEEARAKGQEKEEPPAVPQPAHPDSVRLMMDALHRALDRMMAALTVVNLREWRERRGR